MNSSFRNYEEGNSILLFRTPSQHVWAAEETFTQNTETWLHKHKLEAWLLQSSCSMQFRFNVREMFPVRWYCSPTLAECLPKLRLRESTTAPQPNFLYPRPASRDNFRTNCENRMFGNPVWYLCWQIFIFISAMLWACCPRGNLIKLNFWEFLFGQPTKVNPFRCPTSH